MDVFKALLCSWTICNLLLVGEAFIHIDVDQQEVVVEVHESPVNGSRRRRSTDGFPEAFDVDFKSNDLKARISLSRNYDVSDDVPVLLMRSKIIKYRFDSKEPAAYYFDLENGASFMAWQKNEETSSSEQYNLFGTFVSGNDEFLIQPPGGGYTNHTLAKITNDSPVRSDYVLNPDFDIDAAQESYQIQNTTTRKKRADIIYEVEIFFVIDYAIYQR